MFKKLFTLTFISFFIVSCEPVAKTAADGYKFGTPQFSRDEVQIKVVKYNSRQELLRAGKLKGATNPDLVAFSILSPPFNSCTIHMMNPEVEYEPEFIGHELTHCLYGQWHTDNNSRS
jgi:hypothetical protein